MARSIFISGGAGFIGSRLAWRMAGEADRITVYDSLHPQVHGPDAAPPPLPDNAEFVKGDVSDTALYAETVARSEPDLIYHLAAETGTGQSYDEPARYSAVNVMGTATLIEAVRKLPGAERRIVLAGSRAVYGEGAYRRADGTVIPGPYRTAEALAAGEFAPKDADGAPLEPVPTPEDLPPTPASVYASTKLMQEYLLSQCAAEGDFEVALLRFQNVYGPGQSLNNPYTGVLSIFSDQILDGKRLRIFEDGDIVRDFVFVDDVVEALALAGLAETPPEGPVNIGSAHPATIREAAEILLGALGASPDNYDITGDFRPGDIRYAVADIGKAKATLGWTPQVSLKQGLTALAEWAKAERES